MSGNYGPAPLDRYFPTQAGVLVWLGRAAAERPQTLLWLFILAHATWWATAGSLLQYTMTADNFEMAAWGREWQLGYWKHPPLPAWVLEIAIVATDRAHWMPYVLSQAFVALTFWAVWKLACEIVDQRRALIAVIFLVGVSAFDYEAFRFNHNISSLPWRALAAWSLYRGLRGGRMADWLLLGVWMAIGMLGKYDILFLLVPLGILALVHPATRRFVTTPGPYAAVALSLVLLAPHLVWRFEHGLAGAIDAPQGRMSGDGSFLGHIRFPAEFIANVAFMILPAIVIAAVLRGRWRAPPASLRPDSFARWFVAIAALAPVGVAVATSAVTGLRLPEAWAVPMLDFVGLFIVVFIAGDIDEMAVRRFFATAIVATVAVLAGTTWHSFVVEPFFLRSPGSSRMPGQELADVLTERWRAATNGAPLRYVVGAPDHAGRLAYYAPTRPSLFEDADPTRSPWIDRNDLERQGALAVWAMSDMSANPPGWFAKLARAEVQPPVTFQAYNWGPVRTAIYGWAIVPPAQAAGTAR